MLARRLVAFALACALVFGTLFVPSNTIAASPPALSLPIPLGETWKVIQGYNCGTHTSYDDNAFDLVNTSGRTRGAPVRAAADGTYWWWGAAGGTVILSHGNGYYTMYSHLESRVPFSKGQPVAAGTVIGTVGSAGTSYSNPHLHFEMFYGEGVAAKNRRGVALAFVEGYNFPDHERCNEYMGERLTAGAAPRDVQPPTTPTLLDAGQGRNQIVRWQASSDAETGVQGYQVYVGTDAQGAGEWFVLEPQVALPTLPAGHYFVRVRAIDKAGNASPWVTLVEVNL
ncbi:MAG TPA: peptidoglycan DD-metalloendopeptidase family protein [Herpetosiphonaceae bacterium]